MNGVPMDDDKLMEASEAYVDGLFGEGAGEAHSRFLDHLESDGLRSALHGYHVLQADTQHLSREENYLIGLCVLAAAGSWGPVGMFAKTLRHLGVPGEKILEACGRLSMWIGGIRAAEAAVHVQRAIRAYDREGPASMQPWFPGMEMTDER